MGLTIDVRRDEVPTDNWYKIYVDTLMGMSAIPLSINPALLCSLSWPITRSEMAWMIITVSEAKY